MRKLTLCPGRSQPEEPKVIRKTEANKREVNSFFCSVTCQRPSFKLCISQAGTSSSLSVPSQSIWWALPLPFPFLFPASTFSSDPNWLPSKKKKINKKLEIFKITEEIISTTITTTTKKATQISLTSSLISTGLQCLLPFFGNSAFPFSSPPFGSPSLFLSLPLPWGRTIHTRPI